MPRNAATRSCSTITCSPVADSSACAGETVPQNGQTRAFLAGFHCASPPQAGQENFFWAVASVISLVTHEAFGFYETQVFNPLPISNRHTLQTYESVSSR